MKASVGLVLVLAGCALTSKSEVLDVHWYSPESVKTQLTSATPAQAGPELELGRVWAGRGLREKIAYRDSAHEIGYHEDKRWTERPEVYVRREIARTLFEERGMRRSVSGNAPVLDVEVLAFEEVRSPTPAARIQVRVVVHDDRESLLEKTITVERAAASKDFGALVQAMAQALDAVGDEVAREVQTVAR
jgi:cholesterol transport system auxiliary component